MNLEHQDLLLTFYFHILLDSLRKAKFALKFFSCLRNRLYERNWFTFGSPRCSKNEPGLKIFLVLYDEKNHTFHKGTQSEPERAFYYFFKFLRRLVLHFYFIECFIFEYFYSLLVWPWTATIMWDFQSVYGSVMAHLGVLVRSNGVNQFT